MSFEGNRAKIVDFPKVKKGDIKENGGGDGTHQTLIVSPMPMRSCSVPTAVLPSKSRNWAAFDCLTGLRNGSFPTSRHLLALLSSLSRSLLLRLNQGTHSLLSFRLPPAQARFQQFHHTNNLCIYSIQVIRELSLVSRGWRTVLVVEVKGKNGY